MNDDPMPDNEDIYKQFLIDGPRTRIYIDGHLENVSPQCLFSMLINRYDKISTGIRFVFWCTQTALASIYKRKLIEINPGFHHGNVMFHILDNGSETIHIEKYKMRITKPFTVCEINPWGEGNAQKVVLQKLELHITVSAKSVSYTVQWHTLPLPTIAPTAYNTTSESDPMDGESWTIVSGV
jgi:hypothetical protein